MRSTLLPPLLLLAGCAAPERPHLATHARSPADPYLVRPAPGDPSDAHVLRRTKDGPRPDDLAGLERAVGIGPGSIGLGAATVALLATAAEAEAAERFLADRVDHRGRGVALEARVLRLLERQLPRVDGVWPAGPATVATIVSAGAPLAALLRPAGGVEFQHVASGTTTDGVEAAVFDLITRRAWIAGWEEAGGGLRDLVIHTDEDRARLLVLPWLTPDGRALLEVRLELTIHDTDGRGPPVRQAGRGGAPELDLTAELPRAWTHAQTGRAHLGPGDARVLVSSPPGEELLVTVVSWSPAPRP